MSNSASLIYKLLVNILLVTIGSVTTYSQSYTELADSAYIYAQQERWLESERLTIAALRSEPDNPSNHLLLANLSAIRNEIEDYRGAAEAAEIGLAAAPRSTTLLFNHAYALSCLEDFDSATTDLNKAIDVDSIHEKALSLRGSIYLKQLKTEEAKHDFSVILRHNDSNSLAHASLGLISHLHGEDYSITAEHYRKAAESSHDPEYHFYHILYLALSGDEEKASTLLHDCLARDPHYGNYYIVKGYLHRRKYQYDDMKTDLDLAVAYGCDRNILRRLLSFMTGSSELSHSL